MNIHPIKIQLLGYHALFDKPSRIPRENVFTVDEFKNRQRIVRKNFCAFVNNIGMINEIIYLPMKNLFCKAHNVNIKGKFQVSECFFAMDILSKLGFVAKC